MRRSNLIPASLAALALALAGCLAGPEDRSSGVDDFPNSIYARVDGFLDEGRKADGLAATAHTDSLLIRRPFNGPVVRKLAAGAYGAADPSLARTARRITSWTACASLVAACIAPAMAAEAFPARPVRMLIPFPAGGPADFVGRLFAQETLDDFETEADGIDVPGRDLQRIWHGMALERFRTGWQHPQTKTPDLRASVTQA